MQNKSMIIDKYENEKEQYYMIKPLAHKGFNTHFINLISADVFCTKKVSIFNYLKKFLLSCK